MTGSISESDAKLSAITLALLEDTGWFVRLSFCSKKQPPVFRDDRYRANYAKADSLVYGRNVGCDQLSSQCNDWTL